MLKKIYLNDNGNYIIFNTETEKKILKCEIIKYRTFDGTSEFYNLIRQTPTSKKIKKYSGDCNLRYTFYDKTTEEIMSQIDVCGKGRVHFTYTAYDSKTGKQLIPNLVQDKDFKYCDISIEGKFIIAEIDCKKSKCKKYFDKTGYNLYDLNGNLLFSELSFIDISDDNYLFLSYSKDQQIDCGVNYNKFCYDYQKKKIIIPNNYDKDYYVLKKLGNYIFGSSNNGVHGNHLYDLNGNLLFKTLDSIEHITVSGDFLILKQCRVLNGESFVYDTKNNKVLFPYNPEEYHPGFTKYNNILHINNYFIALKAASTEYAIKCVSAVTNDYDYNELEIRHTRYDIYNEKGTLIFEDVNNAFFDHKVSQEFKDFYLSN